MANASKKHGMGSGLVQGHQTVGRAESDVLDEDDIANHMKGANKLHGNDQSRVRNERLTVPGSQDPRNQPDAVIQRIEAEATGETE